MIATEARAFLRAIAAKPDDDAPRLVFADWLEEHGYEDRAEFIRVQCELARPGLADAPRERLKQREKYLLSHREKSFGMPYTTICRAVEFRRGFVEAITATSRQLIDRTESFNEHGLLREITLDDWRYSSAMEQIPTYSSVKVWNFENLGITNDHLEALGDGPTLRSAERLNLKWNELSRPGISTLMLHPTFERIPTIQLGGNLFDINERGMLSQRFDFMIERAANELYPISPSGDWVSGFDHEMHQVLMINVIPERFRLYAFYFDSYGDLLRGELCDHPRTAPCRGALVDDERFGEFASRIQLIPQMIHVHRFRHFESGVEIADFETMHWELIDHPPTSSASPNYQAFERLKRDWVMNKRFAFPTVN